MATNAGRSGLPALHFIDTRYVWTVVDGRGVSPRSAEHQHPQADRREQRGFALRGSAQTGLRAPSPQQQFFTTTSTNFINGVPFDITTFPATSDVAAALGAQPLEAEESENYSFGAVLDLGPRRRLAD